MAEEEKAIAESLRIGLGKFTTDAEIGNLRRCEAVRAANFLVIAIDRVGDALASYTVSL